LQNACLWKNGEYPKTQYENAQRFKEAQAIKRDEKGTMKTPKQILEEMEKELNKSQKFYDRWNKKKDKSTHDLLNGISFSACIL